MIASVGRVSQRPNSARALVAINSPWDLPPGPAHDILADLPGENRLERTAAAARVGSGKISAGNQGAGSLRATLVGRQRLALPFARLAILAHDAGPWHGDFGLSERARQRALAMPVAAADEGRGGLFIPVRLASPIAWPA